MNDNFLELFKLFQDDTSRFISTIEDEFWKMKKEIRKITDQERIEKIGFVKREIQRILDNAKIQVRRQEAKDYAGHDTLAINKELVRSCKNKLISCIAIETFLSNGEIADVEEN